MKIVVVGAGNVATHLATGLYKENFDIIQIYSRTLESATALSQKVQAAPITDITDISKNADLYIFAIKDSVLEETLAKIPKNEGIWVHTAGSIPLNVFEKYTSSFGVIYPFQTFSKNRTIDWRNTPIFVEASDANTMEILYKAAVKLSSKVVELSSEDRRYLHLTGVFACNFTNHMYAISEQFLKRINLPFDMALPLIDETASKVHELNPSEAQTGPAIRYDKNVINKHLELIDDQDIKYIYKLISENIHKSNK